MTDQDHVNKMRKQDYELRSQTTTHLRDRLKESTAGSNSGTSGNNNNNSNNSNNSDKRPGK